MCGCNAEIEDTKHFLLRCHFYSIQRFEVFNNINKFDPSFTQLDTKEQVNILLYGYPPSKSNALNQDIIKFVINFLKISFNQWFYVLLFFFLPICLFYVVAVVCCCLLLFFVVAVVVVVVVFLENKCSFAAYNWLQISCKNTLLLTNSNFNSFLFVTSYNLQTLIVLCSFIISV